MLSYRHAFHAGNHADVFKHFVLFLILSYFNRKDKPYWYIDTHSGAGLYHLEEDQAQKTGEYRQGIARLLAAQTLPAELEQFRQHLQNLLPQPQLYCGSPLLAQSLLRPNDKLRLFELHPADFPLLRQNTAADRRIIAKQADGYQSLISLLPPPPRRAVILIDPPYEQKQEYRQAVQTLGAALSRFATGCYALWYPCLSREESRSLPAELRKLPAAHWLQAELHAHAPRADGFGMHGSGMFLINPPYVLAEQLAANLPALAELLAQDSSAHFVLEQHGG
ncbi:MULTISPECIES: 23S rRNA (adenine(2030)-N(6))-methyltransferase RlmJ [Eikenella]|uniref:Ribosomal RNA large subunit methyltransferase J n=1 Tax=Eikenella longinqua TaxID=1795827 RepID=A0A1A9RUJ2_9NEIS|nr:MULTISPECIES: 23S rRNA (adenine(2030)-N(6))-methyltransferase RlmJ [Eikenella]OAM26700.1 competence protein ComJ [Eikenella longinqua]